MKVIKISKYIQLEEKLKKYIKNEEELNEIKKSFEFANIKHNGQKRNSGEDYIIHPLNVAFILAGIHADSKTIEAALLHDTIEDCEVSYEEIENLFVVEVAKLFESITKINRLNLL